MPTLQLPGLKMQPTNGPNKLYLHMKNRLPLLKRQGGRFFLYAYFTDIASLRLLCLCLGLLLQIKIVLQDFVYQFTIVYARAQNRLSVFP